MRIAFVGKYVDLTESYKSLIEAIKHAGIHTRCKVNIEYLDSENIEKDGTAVLKGVDAILVPGGFGRRGTEGKIAAIRHARENKVPYLGICLGMQLAVVEFARDVAGMAGAHSTEFVRDTPFPVIGLITEWLDASGKVEKRGEDSDLGGTMRLGAQVCQLADGSLAPCEPELVVQLILGMLIWLTKWAPGTPGLTNERLLGAIESMALNGLAGPRAGRE